MSSIHPSIEHNVAKLQILKKALFFAELEKIEGDYFEFGIFEGTSLLGAFKSYKALHSKIERKFYGFDSFDEGFKYFDKKDEHPFFEEGGFKSSYQKVLKRFKKYSNEVTLIPGFFENSLKVESVKDIVKKTKCAIVFIDCDLMNPAYVALEYIKSAFVKGSIIILDDYWAYKGNQSLGASGALQKFLKKNKNIKLREFFSYGYGGNSFIITDI